MPLTLFQSTVVRLLSVNRTPDSHLAGGAALHFAPNSIRYSNDLDYFQDSVERVASAYAADERLLRGQKYEVTVEMTQPGYIRGQIRKGTDSTKIEWSHDTAWRFMPTVPSPELGYQLHPVDLAVNKLLALAGRDEPRDFLDILYILHEILPLGPLCWAAVGKDPGFAPLSLLELLKRRGRNRPEDFSRLKLVEKPDLQVLKTNWLAALESASKFIKERPPEEVGCLYYSAKDERFISPRNGDKYIVHYGRPGGIIPMVVGTST